MNNPFGIKEEKEKVFSVSEVQSKTNVSLQAGEVGGRICVKGELGSVKSVPFSKVESNGSTLTFNLKEGKKTLPGILFKWGMRTTSVQELMGSAFADGKIALAYGKVEVNDWGKFQFHADRVELESDQIGEWEKKRRALNEKLQKAGYYSPDHKKKVPKYPKTLGIITSGSGMAINDFVEPVMEREPGQEIIFCPVTVQGQDAPMQIANAIMALESHGVDVIALGRGGGSRDDLYTFDTEEVADAIFHCTIPIVSAVGHTNDFSVADQVSDAYVRTPTAVGAYLIPKTAQDRLEEIRKERERAELKIANYLQRLRTRTQKQENGLARFAPEERLKNMSAKTKNCQDRLTNRMEQILRGAAEQCRRRADELPVKLDTRMERAKNRYKIVYDGMVVRSPLTQHLMRAKHRYERSLEVMTVRSPMERRLERAKYRFEGACDKLDDRNPLKKLRGGFGYVQNAEGRTISSFDQVKKGDRITVQMEKGKIRANVEETAAEGVSGA